MAGKIFINYRRDDSPGTAGRLHDRLAQKFGRNNLFMDVDHIPAGVDFTEYLHSQVVACDVFLAVIGPNWLDAKDDSGRRRFDNPDDFVTIEIAAALARNIRVIPVLVDGARTPKADKLPESNLVPVCEFVCRPTILSTEQEYLPTVGDGSSPKTTGVCVTSRTTKLVVQYLDSCKAMLLMAPGPSLLDGFVFSSISW